MLVYVDDIIIIGNDQICIHKLKQHSTLHFQIKDLAPLKYLLTIEVARSKANEAINQRKYAFEILDETNMLDCQPSDTSMDPNIKVLSSQGSHLPTLVDIDV